MTSLRTRLVLVSLTVSALGIGLGMLVAGVSTSGEFRRFVFSLNQQDLQDRLAAYYDEHGAWTGVESELLQGLPPPPDRQPHAVRPGMFTLVDESGRVVVGGAGFVEGELLARQELEGLSPIAVAGTTVGWAAVPGNGFVPMGGEAVFFRRLKSTLVVGAVLAFAVALAAGALAARSLTRPLRELTEATKAVAAGDFERKVRVPSSDELGALAVSFNRMSEALAESRRLRRQMTADIAHDLRTPLSVILSHLDALDDGVLTDRGEATRIVREETERLSRLVEDLRLLTRADAGELALTTRPTDVGQLVSSVVQAYQPAARAKRIGLAAEVPPAIAPLDLDPDRMRQVLSNLLANAVFHTPTGGRVTLRAEESPEGVRLTMDDTGPGIDADQRERIFDRFYRGDPARRREDGGSGLGLAIARSIVEAHGGRIGVEDAPDGGSRFWLVVPRRGKGAHGGGSDG